MAQIKIFVDHERVHDRLIILEGADDALRDYLGLPPTQAPKLNYYRQCTDHRFASLQEYKETMRAIFRAYQEQPTRLLS